MIESIEFWPDLVDFYSIEKTVICLIGDQKMVLRRWLNMGVSYPLSKAGCPGILKLEQIPMY